MGLAATYEEELGPLNSTSRQSSQMQADAKLSEMPGSQSWTHFVAGGSGATVATTVTFPLDVVKTRAQSDLWHLQSATKPGLHQLKPIRQGTIMMLLNIYKYEGWRTLFRGLGPNLCSFVPETAIGFYAYGSTKRFLMEKFNNGKESAVIHLSAAAIAGISTETCTNPLWVIKTQLQLDQNRSDSKFRGPSRAYTSSWDCATKIVQSEGIRGLYRGLTLSYLGVTEFAIQWVLYEHIKATFNIRQKGHGVNQGHARHDTSSNWIVELCAGGGSKLVAAVVAYPHEVIRTRLRQPLPKSGMKMYTGNVQCFKVVWKQEGLAGLYGGLRPHLLRVVPGAAVLFGTYEMMLRLLDSTIVRRQIMT